MSKIADNNAHKIFQFETKLNEALVLITGRQLSLMPGDNPLFPLPHMRVVQISVPIIYANKIRQFTVAGNFHGWDDQYTTFLVHQINDGLNPSDGMKLTIHGIADRAGGNKNPYWFDYAIHLHLA